MSTERVARKPALSPSRLNDFMQCPLLFRFRAVDRLPEPASAAAARGTLVHLVIERLFDVPLGERTPEAAAALLPGAWEHLLATDKRLGGLAVDDDWLAAAERLVRAYFDMEDPNRLEPAGRELVVEHQLDDGPLLRGIIDRLDVAPGGAMRIVDYKTGRSPKLQYESQALFQMRFYALLLWLGRGEMPKMLQVMYLGDGQVLRAEPRPEDLEATEAKVRSLWDSIVHAVGASEFRPRPSALCNWCSHQALCPQFGGTPPEFDAGLAAERLGVPAGAAVPPQRPDAV